MENKPLVSLVIPVYNVGPYLKRCLDSVKKQTYSNFEAIIVNDGSTDNSRDIALSFVQEDSRFILKDKKNGGLSSARNEGLKFVKGDFIIFIDSDDWAEDRYVEEMVENIVHYNSDFACCRLKYVNIEKKIEKIYGHAYRHEILKDNEILRDSLLVENIHTPVWAKIYRTSFLKSHDIQFKEGIVNEDTLFTTIVSSLAKKVSFVNKVLFNSLERSGSISRSSQEKLFRDMKIALDEISNFLKRNGLFNDELQPYLETRYIRSMLYNLLQSAQRLDRKKYYLMHNICFNETEYVSMLNKKLLLSKKHYVVAILSKHTNLFFITVRILNLMGFRMH